ncbi:MAG: hypothetical protein HQL32_15625 [Planctomycetes bacterium]|nr:hypothetical protein [Planctomycetota bacterium]
MPSELVNSDTQLEKGQLKTKLLGGAGLLFLLSLFVIMIAIFGMNDVVHEAHTSQIITFPVLEKSNRLMALVERSKTVFLDSLEFGDDVYIEELKPYKEDFMKIIKEMSVMDQGSELKYIGELYHKYVSSCSKVVEKYSDSEVESLAGGYEPLRASADNLISYIESYKMQKLKHLNDDLSSIQVKGTTFEKIFIILAIILSIVSFIIAMFVFKMQNRLLENNIQLREGKENLNVALKKTQAANIAKSEFLATMSHEIKTPLNGVMGMADMLTKTDLTEDQKSFTDILMKSSRNLLAIVNDVLDYSNIESGKVELVIVSCNIQVIVADLRDCFDEQMSQKHLKFHTKVDERIPKAMAGDPVRIQQVLTHLISNAIKFTEEGSIQLNVILENIDEAGGHSLKFEVRDTGIGISSEVQKKLFQKFMQADMSTTRRYGGIGLGLAICKDLVDMMHGNIGVNSQTGQGSVFYFTINLSHINGDLESIEGNESF